MEIKVHKIFILLIVTLALAGCATMSTPPKTILTPKNPELAWKKYKPILDELTHWESRGVIGIRIKNKGESANFIWKQNQHDFDIEIYGPLGIGAVSVKSNTQKIALTKSDGKIYSAKSAETLMNQQLGWHVPIRGLHYWGKGLPDPNLPYTNSFNPLGLISQINQSGWSIKYSKFLLQGNHYPLPSKIIMKQNNLTLTIINKYWDFSWPKQD